MSAEQASVPLASPQPLERIFRNVHSETQLAFLSPYLRPGLRILDCACGMGQVTCELARWVEPGFVTGIDAEAGQIAQARALAATEEIGNVQFETGSILEIPFADDTFDLAFCNGVLCHLQDPAAALVEMQRVVRPGGVISAREPDYSATLCYPNSLGMEQAFTLQLRALAALGAKPNIGRQLRNYFAEAGMNYAEGSASFDSYGTPEAIEALADHLKEAWRRSDWATYAVNQGWIDYIGIAAFLTAIDDFAEDPYSFLAVPWCEAVSSN